MITDRVTVMSLVRITNKASFMSLFVSRDVPCHDDLILFPSNIFECNQNNLMTKSNCILPTTLVYNIVSYSSTINREKDLKGES